jgi:hypothetical protein
LRDLDQFDTAAVDGEKRPDLRIEHDQDERSEVVVPSIVRHDRATLTRCAASCSSRVFCAMSIPNMRAWFSPRILIERWRAKVICACAFDVRFREAFFAELRQVMANMEALVAPASRKSAPRPAGARKPTEAQMR